MNLSTQAFCAIGQSHPRDLVADAGLGEAGRIRLTKRNP